MHALPAPGALDMCCGYNAAKPVYIFEQLHLWLLHVRVVVCIGKLATLCDAITQRQCTSMCLSCGAACLGIPFTFVSHTTPISFYIQKTRSALLLNANLLFLLLRLLWSSSLMAYSYATCLLSYLKT